MPHFFSETLIVTKQSIAIIHKNLANTKESVVNFNEIHYFGFANQQYTKHTMDNPTLDVTGLAQRESELQYIIDEGNIKIETSSKAIKFGKNMPSWDVEEVIEEIEEFTGLKFKTPIPQHFEDESVKEFDSETEEELQTEEESESETSETLVKKHTYTGDFGTLVIEQKTRHSKCGRPGFFKWQTRSFGKIPDW